MCNEITLGTVLYHTYRLILSKYSIKSQTLLLRSKEVPDFQQLENCFWVVKRIVSLCSEEHKIVVLSNHFNCAWVGIPYSDKDIYVLGPVFLGNITQKQFVDGVCKEAGNLGLTFDMEKLKSDYTQIPVMTFQELKKHVAFLSGLLTGIVFNEVDLFIANTLPKAISAKQNEEDIYNIQVRNFFAAIQAERFILNCVRNGDVERMKNMPHSISITSSGNIGPDELRLNKNAGIVLISLITRAMIDEGIPAEIAFPLSDMYILQMEKMTDVAVINKLQASVIYDFTQRVRENKNAPKYTSLINQCCGFIIANINKPLKLVDVASNVGMNPEALSRRFVKETGITIPNYILSKKIEEAKLLLSYTNKTSIEISNILGFSTQSQFIVAFKRQEGKTPMEYRRET